MLKGFLAVVGGLVVLLLIVGVIATNDEQDDVDVLISDNQPANDNQSPVEEIAEDPVVATGNGEVSAPEGAVERFIPGIEPVDVYGNLENEGFTTQRNIRSSDRGSSWISEKTVAGLEYEVVTFSPDVSRVESVEATAYIDAAQKDPGSTLPFFLYISSLPYDGANPAEISAWIQENFDNDNASHVISDVRFTIYAPTPAIRMLRLERISP
jgi:hypothetical protein